MLAVRSGIVVYSGDGLSNYGKLVIIKHDDCYLSAYAYNKKLLVGEGERVKPGQKIAEIGTSGSTQLKSPQLYFEIRKDGQPVDPERYIKIQPVIKTSKK